jgi:hypothetical protein
VCGVTGYTREIASAAHKCGLEPSLVTALVLVESGGNRWAWNPEPRYRYLWNVRANAPFRALTPDERASEVPPDDFHFISGDRDQEWWGQQASWGLCQIMGALARELRFRGPYLPELCDPDLNLTLGCRHLRQLVDWAEGQTSKALGAYNAGRGGWNSADGLAYTAKVLRRYEALRGEAGVVR